MRPEETGGATQALRAGLLAAARNARNLWWLLAANVVLAFAAMAPLMTPLQESLAYHEASAQLTRRFDTSWWLDVTTSKAESFARALDAVGVSVFLAAILGAFFAGGMIQSFHDTMEGRSMDRFMTSCRRWFPRFAFLFALSLPLYWIVHRLVNTHLALAMVDVLENVEDERVGLAINLGRALLFLCLFDLVTLMVDYARVHAVVAQDRSMISSLSAGMWFVLQHPARVLALELMGLGTQLIALLLFLPVDDLIGRNSWAGLVAGIAAGQAYLLLRLFLREASRAGQVAIYRRAAVRG